MLNDAWCAANRYRDELAVSSQPGMSIEFCNDFAASGIPKQSLGRDQRRLTCSRLAMADTYSTSLVGNATDLLLHNKPIKIFHIRKN